MNSSSQKNDQKSPRREPQPTVTSSWAPDLPFAVSGLTFILMGIILCQSNAKDVPRGDGLLPLWIDAFCNNHPIILTEGKHMIASILSKNLMENECHSLLVGISCYF